jgi:hypothetical protein
MLAEPREQTSQVKQSMADQLQAQMILVNLIPRSHLAELKEQKMDQCLEPPLVPWKEGSTDSYLASTKGQLMESRWGPTKDWLMEYSLGISMEMLSDLSGYL